MGNLQRNHYTTSTSCEQQLSPIKSTRYPNPNDMKMDDWDTPLAHLKKKPPFYRIADKDTRSDPRVKNLLAPHVRRLARSLVLLAACNRRRGYDVSQSLHLNSLLVSKTHHEFAIKNLRYQSVSEPFLGYKVAGKLLSDLLEASSYEGCIEDLTDDVSYLLDLMESDDDPNPSDKLLVYNAAFLSRRGRIGLTIRFDSFVRNDRFFLKGPAGQYMFTKWIISSNFVNLPSQYLSRKSNHFLTDELHQDFKSSRLKSEDLYQKLNSQVGGQQGSTLEEEQHGDSTPVQKESIPEIDCLEKTGRWLVILNRHVLMHPHKRLQSEAVDLLHCYTPLYLQYAQKMAEHWDFWDELHMQDFFTEDITEFRFHEDKDIKPVSNFNLTLLKPTLLKPSEDDA